MTLDNLLGKGLEKAATDREEIARYLTKIQRRIEDCGKNNISLDSRFDIGFEALLQIALAALRANGYRTTSQSGHQQVAIQLLPRTIGIESSRIRTLDEYRKKRSLGLYDADFEPSLAEVSAVAASVEQLLQDLVAWMRQNTPELVG